MKIATSNVNGITARLPVHWKYYRGAFERDAGLRIDHVLLSPAHAAKLTAAGVGRRVRGAGRPSDHAPVWIELAD
jgi:exodeoxyribonuclease-3